MPLPHGNPAASANSQVPIVDEINDLPLKTVGNASVMVGQVAAGALAPMQAGMNITTSEGHMLSGNMHGMQVLKSYTPAQKSGALLVALDKEAMFSLSYNGLSEDEALALAEKFDWKAIQAATKK